MNLCHDMLAGQFILAHDAGVLPAGWPVRRLGDWRLASHPDLPVADITAADRAAVGWLLGYPLGPDGRRAAGSVRFPLKAADKDTAARFEAALYEYGGRFAAVLLGAGAGRLYLDAAGSLGVVYCPAHRMAASTTTLIPRDGDCGDAIIPELGIPARDGSYPFGLTPRRGAWRLMPNHFLDLLSWQAVRHWPAGDLAPADPPRAVAEVASILRRHIAAMAREAPLHMSLTAGRDTRMMLACAREHVDRIAFYTVRLPNEPAKLDCQVAPKIARRLGLRHVIIDLEDVSEADGAEWLYRTGGCAGGLHPQMFRTMERLDPARPILLGTGGELGRAFHWREGDTESSAVTAEDLLTKLDIPRTPAVLEQAARWRAGVPTASAITIWGLLNIEQQLGCWAAPLYYGYRRGGFCLLPFAHRGIFERILGLPVEYRRGGGVEKDLIGGAWPELLAWPFNWPLGIRGYMYSLQWRAAALRRRLAGGA